MNMIYTDNTKKAMKLCFKAHKDQVDKSGMPYVFHPFHVAEQMTDEVTTIVALLHDVVEDTDYTLEDIAAEGFGEDILEAVALMTHEDDVPYLDYVAKLKDNPIARAVKLADLAHNSDLSRIGEIDEETKQRLEKYKKAKAILESGK
jgi:(p)ppGpp synthase/HD superfamily hydrolase